MTAGSALHADPQRGRRGRVDDEGYLPYLMTKTSTWFLITRAHAELASTHVDDHILGLPDELYMGTLLKTYGLQNETTCDWMGPTYTNWTWGGWHPITYTEFDGDVLRRMRVASVFADVDCDWQAALDQAEDPGHFFSLSTNQWMGSAPEFRPMHGSCPLFARKLAVSARAGFMAALWPAFA